MHISRSTVGDYATEAASAAAASGSWLQNDTNIKHVVFPSVVPSLEKVVQTGQN